MNFDFDDEHYMFQQTVRDTLAAEFPLDTLRDGGNPAELDVALWPKLAELGLFGLMVPEEQGGLGLSPIEFALISEEFGAALVPLTVTDTIVASLIMARFDAEAQAGNLQKLAEGSLRVACAVYEKDGGYDPAAFENTLDANGKLNGRKLLIAGALRADFLLVVVRDATGQPCLALVEPDRGGVSVVREQALDISGDYYSVEFADVTVSSADRIGGGAEAVECLVDMLATAASQSMAGIGARMLDTTVAYVKEREQFGQPVGAFQAVKHRCADMAVDLNTARSGAYYAGWAMAAAQTDERVWAVSMAKAKANRMAVHILREAIQLHGGMGYTWEMALHFHFRRGRLLETLYGSTEFHNERVLAGTIAQLAAQ